MPKNNDNVNSDTVPSRDDGVNDSLLYSILESISDGVFTVDTNWIITSFNRAAEKITGVERDNAIGRPCWEVFRADACEAACPLRQTLKSGKPVINRTAAIISSSGRRVPVSLSTALLRDSSGTVIGGAETFRDLSTEEELKDRLQCGAIEIISHSQIMREILSILPNVAGCDSTVVIRGETGTGKELLARTIHNLSPRREAPFIAVNCAALPDSLLESELFGYKKGAFTGAGTDKPGRFTLAQGGTVFLDEIGDISPTLQVKLLRVLQERTYEPLGGTRTINADIRIITATHRDLEEMVAAESFRRDLYYRINIIRLDLPPLRQRREDIPLLADHFIRRFNQSRHVHLQGLSPSALAILQNHDFPGNIRELENIIERSYVLCHTGEIQPTHLPAEIMPSLNSTPTAIPESLNSYTREAESRTIMSTLQKHNYNRTAAALELGIHKSTLHRKIHSLNLNLPPKDGRHR